MVEPIISQNFASKSGAIDPADFDDAFGDLVSKFDGGIDNSNIALNAGIDYRKFANPNNWFVVPRTLLADSAGTNGGPSGGTDANWASAPTDFTLDASPRHVTQQKFRLDSSQLLWLCCVDIYAVDITATGPYPQVEIYKNGTLIPGGTCVITTDLGAAPSDPYFRLYRTNPIANPLMSFADGDVLEYKLGRSAAGSPRARGIYVNEVWKSTPVR